MTLQECRNLFITDYKIECLKRGVDIVDLANQDKIIASLISEGQREIADRLKILSSWEDITLSAVTTFTTYDLNTNFLKVDRVELLMANNNNDAVKLQEVPIQSIPSMGDLLSGTPDRFAIFNDGGAQYKITFYPLSNAAGTIRVWYYIDPGIYSPSGASSQDWGTFDGITFRGTLKIPRKYIVLLITYMLGKFFPDKQQEFEFKLEREKGNKGNSGRQGISYNLGGYL